MLSWLQSCLSPRDAPDCLQVHELGLEFDRASLQRIFSEIDADRTQKLSFDEFKVLMQRWKGFHHHPDFKG